MLVAIQDFRALNRNSLRGFATVLLPAGIIVHDVPVHVTEGKAWAAPPGRPVLGRDGRQATDPAGRAQWAPLMTFASKADRDAFSEAVIDALRRKHPEALV